MKRVSFVNSFLLISSLALASVANAELKGNFEGNPWKEDEFVGWACEVGNTAPVRVEFFDGSNNRIHTLNTHSRAEYQVNEVCGLNPNSALNLRFNWKLSDRDLNVYCGQTISAYAVSGGERRHIKSRELVCDSRIVGNFEGAHLAHNQLTGWACQKGNEQAVRIRFTAQQGNAQEEKVNELLANIPGERAIAHPNHCNTVNSNFRFQWPLTDGFIQQHCGKTLHAYAYFNSDSDRIGSFSLPCPAPPKPTDIPDVSRVLNVPSYVTTESSFRISWGAVYPSAATYELQERFNNGAWRTIADQSNTIYQVPLRSQGGQYQYRVRACTSTKLCGGYRESRVVNLVTETQAKQRSAQVPIGNFEGAAGDALRGWACTLKQRQPIAMRLFFGEKGDFSNPYQTLSASTSSEQLIKDRCQLSSSSFNYRATRQLSVTERAQICGRSLSAYASTNGGIEHWVGTQTIPCEGGKPKADNASLIAPSEVFSDNSFQLRWSGFSGAIAVYELQERVPGGNWAQIQRSSSAQRTMVASKQLGSYQYRVRACSSSNECSAYVSKTVEVKRGGTTSGGVPALPAFPGGDDIGSLAGQFRVTESGASSYSVPIATTSGTAGVAPTISLQYSSQGGNGLAGVGWNLSGLSSISRCRQTHMVDGRAEAINFTDSDRFCLDGQRLISVAAPAGQSGRYYKTEVDNFATIVARGGSAATPAYFEVQRKDGSKSVYGNSSDSQQRASGQVINWAINRFEDSVGNPITFQYLDAGQGFRIDRINYAFGSGNSPQAYLRFSYEARSDVRSQYLAGVQSHRRVRLKTIESFNTGQLLRSYKLQYLAENNVARVGQDVLSNSRLRSIQECAAGNICLPATSFDWDVVASRSFGSEQRLNLSPLDNRFIASVKTIDVNGDGILDLVWLEADQDKRKGDIRNHFLYYSITSSNPGVSRVAQVAHHFRHAGLKQAFRMETLDYNNDGRQDVLIFDSSQNSHLDVNHGKWRLFMNTSNGYGPPRFDEENVNFPFNERRVSFMDINGDGLTDAAISSQSQNLFQAGRDDRYYLLQSSNESVYSYTPYSFGGPNKVSGTYNSRGQLAPGVCDQTIEIPAGDLNGDGQVDYLTEQYCGVLEYIQGPNEDIVTSQRTGRYRLSLTKAASNGYYLERFNTSFGLPDKDSVRFADMNADGLSDVLVSRHNGWFLYYSTGTGLADSGLGAVIPAASNTSEDQSVQLVDYNYDGYMDVVWRDGTTLYVKQWQPATRNFSTAIILSSSAVESGQNIVADLNGDGVLDFTTIDKRYLRQYNGSSPSSGSIVQITNGLGAVTRINYEPLSTSRHYSLWDRRFRGNGSDCDYICDTTQPFNGSDGLQNIMPLSAVIQLHGSMYVATRVQSSAPTEQDRNQLSAISYFYSEAKMQAGGRGFLGFRSLTTLDEQTRIETSTRYRQDWPFIGYPAETEVRLEDSHRISHSTNEWRLQGFNPSWVQQVRNGTATIGSLRPYIKRSSESNRDLNSGRELTGTTTENQYDAYGNPTNITTVTFGNGIRSEKRTVNTYSASGFSLEESRRLGRLSSTRVTTIREESGQPRAEQTRNSQFAYYSSGKLKGLLEKETVEPGGSQDQKLETTHHYDNFGNKTHTMSRGWDGGATVNRQSERLVYDAHGRYVDAQHQRFDGRNAEIKVLQVLARNHYGSITKSEDLNGVITDISYSPMGKQYSSKSSIQAWSRQYMQLADSQCLPGAAYKVLSESADGMQAQECFDRLGRSQRKLSRNLNGRWVAVDSYYDNLSRTVKVSEPYFVDGGQRHYSTMGYDRLGRVLGTQLPDGSISRINYNEFATTYTNGLNQTKLETRNALGELVRVQDHIGGFVLYRYDVNGQLARTEDSAGNAMTIVYDLLGRKTQMDDPDKGQWRYRYNAFGELIEQTDAKNQRTQLRYDTQGRMVSRSEGGLQSHWRYDTAAQGVGQLAQVSDNASYNRDYVYDNYGRLSQVHYKLPGLSDTQITGTTYDAFGRVFGQFDVAHPLLGNHGIKNIYNRYGYLEQVADTRSDGPVYLRNLEVDPRSQASKFQLGSGAIVTRRYDPKTGRLLNIDTESSSGAQLQALSYDWDVLGNLKHREERSGGKNLSETFKYDGLNRLTEAKLGNGQTKTVSYDAIGNIISKSDVGSYTYGESAGPHAVTSTSGAGQNNQYQYDANGNNTRTTGDMNRTIAYSHFDKATRIVKDGHTTEFSYDPDRSRYKRVDNNSSGQRSTTFYLGNVEIVQRANSVTEYKRRIAGVAIQTLRKTATIDQPGRQLHYLLQDHLGSLDVIIDEQSNIVQEFSFDAWGARRSGTDWAAMTQAQVNALVGQFTSQSINLSGLGAITTRGFTDHEMLDEVGIVHMNGRIYDAKLGRFLQADPHIDGTTNTQGFNRYSYLHNNPLNGTDPTGYFSLREWVAPIVAVVGAWLCQGCAIQGYIAVGAAAGAAGAAANGQNIFLGAFTGAVSAAAFYGIGQYFQSAGIENLLGVLDGDVSISSLTKFGGNWLTGGQIAGQISLHAMAGGVMSVLQGGKFGHGFISAGLTKGVLGKYGAGGYLKRALAHAVVGGTVSELTGGKFANGARTATYQYLFNELSKWSFKKLKESYPSNKGLSGGDVVDNAGGKVSSNFALRNTSKDPLVRANWSNTCAARMSYCLNKAGYPVPSPASLPSDIRALSSDGNGNYIYGASDMARYIEGVLGSPLTVKNDLSNITGKTGIIYFENYHIDLWDKKAMVGNTGSISNYIGKKKAFFWEVK
ncbi:T6SS effector amidase Tae4 family protein [Pseudoteredinibacter isoporae]|uniref:RHS repeat-associated protein n=1 Tax=Pseudoteredinibacter isoporae TaxID=570281 RepID=A0A7X0MZR6_9GAMM|nr:T6SS effector amidase Tae4 family protein [Pseudoteredinibacter isoporae]MBB6523442.1 RHS repeat-associated protein [Pseudoteredinibacter isoporae]NHO88951.1 hypothetical protein [Pseudoteredinibacter isoporae]NIB24341.1 hypothetical protein [Pseudoteredinibacter isoporae]